MKNLIKGSLTVFCGLVIIAVSGIVFSSPNNEPAYVLLVGGIILMISGLMTTVEAVNDVYPEQ